MSLIINISDYVLYEDDYILLVNKPASLMVEPDRNGHPNLLYQVRKYFKTIAPENRELYAQHIHRLDRPVSGVVLFAKQKTVLKNLSEQFAERKVKKFYTALTINGPSIQNGKLENWLRKEKKKAILFENEFPNAEKVTLAYHVKRFSDMYFVWDIELHTGKFHQIRAQLAHAGFPIVGDILYGSTKLYKPDAIALHACKLIFNHPITDKEMQVESQLIFEPEF